MYQTEDQHSFPLPATKVLPPRLPQTLVKRERLLEALESAFQYRLVLCSASAGSGKTTLLSTWATRLATHSRKAAWLALDEMDNDPTRFWLSVIAALRTCLPTFGETALTLLRSPQPAPIATLLTTVINELLEEAGEIALLLDDYQMIEEKAIHEAVAFLIDHLPANLHLILASRSDPDLPLARWRTRGQMLELRDADLSFTPEETGAFLTHTLAQPISAAEIGQLHVRTEGWIAGLQLAALALRRQEDYAVFLRAFTGNHRYLMDYVQQELLTFLPEPLRQFLLQIAVLPRMNADLCQAVTNEPASQAFLETLERSNLFLVQLDPERRWYRLHELFRDVLHARLQATQPELIPQLHLRAAQFYAAQDAWPEAIEHTLKANNFASAASLMERSAEQFWLCGEALTVHHWMMELPPVMICEHPRFALTSALYVLHALYHAPETQRANTISQVEHIMAQIESLLQHAEDSLLSNAERVVLSRRLRLLHSLKATRDAHLQNDVRQLRLLTEQVQELVEEEELAWKLIPLFTLVVSHDAQGASAALLPLLVEVKHLAERAQDLSARLRVAQWLEYAYQAAGQLHQAHQECLHALQLLKQGEKYLVAAGYISLDLADLYWIWNQLDKAHNHLQALLQKARIWQHQDLLIWSLCGLVQVHLSTGEYAAAVQALEEAKALVKLSESMVYRPWITALQVRLWLAQGNIQEASAWAAHAHPTFNMHALEYVREEEYLALARVFLGERRYGDAWHWLEALRVRAENDRRRRDVIRYLAWQVAVLHCSGKTAQARDLARHLLIEAEPEDYIRVYLEVGEPMKQVLQHLLAVEPSSEQKTSAVSHIYISTLLTAFATAQQTPHTKLLESFAVRSDTLQRALPQPSTHPALIEPLSPQELRVLRLLVAGRSNPEIANNLVVSVNTIKTQVQSIYRKLGVANRVEASAAARDLQLL